MHRKCAPDAFGVPRAAKSENAPPAVRYWGFEKLRKLGLVNILIALLSVAIWLLPPAAAAQVRHAFEAFGSIGGVKYDASKSHEFNFGGGFDVRPNRTSGESNLILPAINGIDVFHLAGSHGEA